MSTAGESDHSDDKCSEHLQSTGKMYSGPFKSNNRLQNLNKTHVIRKILILPRLNP